MTAHDDDYVEQKSALAFGATVDHLVETIKKAGMTVFAKIDHAAGAKEVGKQAQRLIGLTQPAIDWVSLAKGMGVPGVRVETAEDLVREFERALAEAGPQLIEAIL